MSRYETENKEYFEFRNQFKDRSFTIDDLDHFSLFVGIHNFARKKFIIDEFEKTLDVSGNIYEFGTWRGSIMMLLAGWYRLRRPQSNKIIYVFDTFEGLSDGTPDDGNAFQKYTGRYTSDENTIRDLVSRKGLDSYITFVVGDAFRTSKEHFSTAAFPKVSFALLDMDLYEPTKAAIDELLPNLTPQGKILFDEGTSDTFEGEQKSLAYIIDKAEKLGIHYSVEENHLTRQPTTVFTRTK